MDEAKEEGRKQTFKQTLDHVYVASCKRFKRMFTAVGFERKLCFACQGQSMDGFIH